MHAEIHQLIALRDGGPVNATIRTHVDTCALCQERMAQHARLRDALRGMPEEAPPADAWQRLQRARSFEAGRAIYGKRYLASAAAVLALVIVVLSVHFTAPSNTNNSADSPAMSAGSVTLAQLQQHSLELEYALRHYGADTMMSLETADVIVDLQDSIALIDFQLENVSTEDRKRELWHERVELMQTLVMVRAAEQTIESI